MKVSTSGHCVIRLFVRDKIVPQPRARLAHLLAGKGGNPAIQYSATVRRLCF